MKRVLNTSKKIVTVKWKQCLLLYIGSAVNAALFDSWSHVQTTIPFSQRKRWVTPSPWAFFRKQTRFLRILGKVKVFVFPIPTGFCGINPHLPALFSQHSQSDSSPWSGSLDEAETGTSTLHTYVLRSMIVGISHQSNECHFLCNKIDTNHWEGTI